MGSDELDEKNFIQERGSKFIWIFLALLIFILALLWGIDLWQQHLEKQIQQNSPFYQVTNREYSLFVWQNPKFKRSEAKVFTIPELADEYVPASAEVLYRYHTWERLVGEYLSPRPINLENFKSFLEENREWLPKYWEQAPVGYKKLIEDLNNLHSLPYEELPFEVKLAFQGWFNTTREWEKIEVFSPSKEVIASFLKMYPHYMRNYWQNLIPGYLREEFPPFLKIALFNFQQSQTHLDR